MRRKALILLLLLAAFGAKAQEVSGGLEAMGFGRIVRDPARAGLAFAGLASLSQGPAFGSVAAVPFYDGTFDGAFSYSRWNPSGECGNHFTLAAAGRLGKRYGISASAALQRAVGYEGWTPTDFQARLGLSMALSELFSVGIGGHYLSSTLSPEDHLSGFAMDLSLLLRKGGFSAFLGLSQLGSASLGDKVYPTAASVSLGAAYAHCFGEHRLEADLDADFYLGGGVILSGGVQYSWREFLFLRGGYHWGSAKAVLPSFASAGLGVHWNGIRLDAAVLLGGPLSRSLTVGIAYGF